MTSAKLFYRIDGRGLACAGLALALALLNGCATFTQYQRPLNGAIEMMDQGDFTGALAKVEDRPDERTNSILYALERGRIAQVGGDIDRSRTEFDSAWARIKENDLQPVVDLSEVGAKAGSLLTNEKSIPYIAKLPGYERVFVAEHQVWNYLASGDLQGASVEVRRANEEQVRLLDAHWKEVAKIEKQASEKQVDLGAMNKQLDEAYRELDDIAAKVKNSFQNAYTFYVSGVVWELMKQPNDAYIDYKKALEIFPDNPHVQERVITLSKQLKFTDDHNLFSKTYGATAAPTLTPAKGEGSVVVLFEEGFVPQKSGIPIILPVPTVGMISFAFPYYDRTWVGATPMSVSVAGGAGTTTEPICYVRALAVKALREQVPGMATREVLRMLIKGTASAVAANNSIWAEIAVDIYNAATTAADRRAWYTLPNSVSVARMTAPAGDQKITLSVAGHVVTVDAPVREGGVTFIKVVGTGNALYPDVVSL
jgi:hypothetical protein